MCVSSSSSSQFDPVAIVVAFFALLMCCAFIIVHEFSAKCSIIFAACIVRIEGGKFP